MHEAFWEAIRVERLIKRHPLRRAKMQEEKSLQTREVPVVESLMENASDEFEEKELESHHSDSADQKMQAAGETKEEDKSLEELEIASKPTIQPMDLSVIL